MVSGLVVRTGLMTMQFAIEDRAKSAVDDPMGRIDLKQQSWSEAQGSRTVNNQHSELLQQIALLSASVQGLGKHMQDGFANEGRRRQEDNEKLKNEMYEGFRNEEKARKVVQNDLAVMKEEIQKLKMESGSTVCSEASTAVDLGASGTFAKPPGIASRYNEVFIPRKMEFKGWITDNTKSSFQGITNKLVVVMIVDLEKMIPSQFHQYVDWNQTRTEQGNWPSKTIVNMATMIGLLKVVKVELKMVSYKIREQEVTARSESPQETLGESTCLVLQGTDSSEKR